MQLLTRSRLLTGSLAALVLLLSVATGVIYSRLGDIRLTAPTTHAVNTHSIVAHEMYATPHYLTIGIASGSGGFSCQKESAPIHCYAPLQIRAAYDIQRAIDAGFTGRGVTMVILDAYQSPTIRHDLALFDKTFGLGATTLNIIAPDGLTPFNPRDPTQVGWAGEISLDVEWAHAIAPDATIDLVLAKSSMDADILSATKYAVDHNLGQVISQSFGEAESCMDPTLMQMQHQLFQTAVDQGTTLFASSGDFGAAQPTCDGKSFFLSVSTPASDPFVTSVGGTHLHADLRTGRYESESAWNDKYGASGGGYSTIYARPGFQSGFSRNSQRGVPDVSYDADVNGGVLVAWSSSGQGPNLFFIFGGTSAGSPQMAAEIALVNQAFGHTAGDINPPLYSNVFSAGSYVTNFHDIVVGNNTFTGTNAHGNPVTIPGYNTKKRWDPVTGLGTFILSDTLFGIPGTN